jgi:hypothetical protein
MFEYLRVYSYIPLTVTLTVIILFPAILAENKSRQSMCLILLQLGVKIHEIPPARKAIETYN